MISIALANHKGGAGKSTTAAMLSADLALRGHRVLLIDGDPQAGASKIFIKPGNIKLSLPDVLLSRRDEDGRDCRALKDVLMNTAIEGLDLVPSKISLASFERERGMTVLRLRKCLREVAGDYDFAFIDTPPNLGLLLSAALAACDRVIIPVQAEPLAADGLNDLLQIIDEAREANELIQIMGALATMYDSRTSVSAQVLDALKEQFPGRTFKTIIHRQTRLSECPAVHQPIQLYAPKSRGSLNYKELGDEVLAILEAERAGAGERR